MDLKFSDEGNLYSHDYFEVPITIQEMRKSAGTKLCLKSPFGFPK